MNKLLAYGIALIILIGIGYAVYMYASKDVTPAAAQTPAEQIEAKREVVYGETAEYRMEVQYPSFGIPEVDAKIKAKVDTAVNAFKQYPTNPPEYGLPKNEQTGSYDVVYIGPDVVSVKLSISEYTGGAHPNTAIIGVNVDRATGQELTLDDVLGMTGLTLAEVAAQSTQTLKTKLGESMFTEGAEAKAENYNTFLVDADSVTFIFQNYQVAAYAAGPQSVVFPRTR